MSVKFEVLLAPKANQERSMYLIRNENCRWIVMLLLNKWRNCTMMYTSFWRNRRQHQEPFQGSTSQLKM